MTERSFLRVLCPVLAAGVLAAGLLLSAAATASAQTPGQRDIAIRDELIAAQESLLNTYRCRFDIDTHIVPGGCVGGVPAQGPTQPGDFPGTPTAADAAERDKLIAEQESLLNTYRCRFNIDVHIVPYDCATGRLLTPLDRLRSQLQWLTIDTMNELRAPAEVPVLQPDEALTAIAQAYAQAMADAQSFGAYFDFWAHLEPDWDFWSIGEPTSISGDISDPRAPGELSDALLGEEGSRLPACRFCTHLATGIVTAADGLSYVTVLMAGRDSGPALSETEMAEAEAEMAELVNTLRSSLGLNTLVYDPGVARAARRWSQIMGARLDFNHNPHAGADYPPEYRFKGENIAVVKLTTTPSDALRLSFGDFVNSRFHYVAMVNPETTHIGIGIVLKAGWLWITQNFAAYP